MWSIHTTEYHSAVRKSEIMPFAAAAWMALETLVLSEVKSEKKDKRHTTSFTRGVYDAAQMNLSPERKQTHRRGEQTCGCQGRDGEAGVTADVSRHMRKEGSPGPLQSMGPGVQEPNQMTEEKALTKNAYAYVYFTTTQSDSLSFAVQQELTHCKLTTFQLLSILKS